MKTKMAYVNWCKWGLAGLAIVAVYGTLMRYKIAFDFPYFSQKNLLHAHSHFAFSGWICHLLYVGIIRINSSGISDKSLQFYRWLIRGNLFSSFGMLIAFTIQGYKAFSLFFSTVTILIALIFCLRFFKDFHNHAGQRHLPWAKAGLLLNVISALGPFALAYLMSSKNFNSDLYLASIYYYLHFQYNGWFFFGAMALALYLLPDGLIKTNNYFKIFAIAAIPTYGLSVLWAKPLPWLYIIIVLAAIAQLLAWIHFLWKLLKKRHRLVRSGINIYLKYFLYVAVIALSIKVVLQAISVIPTLSRLVFGFRPIVIAYLHLVLLGVYSVFILFFVLKQGWIQFNQLSKPALLIFLTGVFLNEMFLGVQGIAAFSYTPIPYMNELLLLAAIVICTGAILLFLSQLKK